MITPERHKSIRKRLSVLWVILTKRLYPVWVLPTHTMSTDEIRDREFKMHENTVPDHEFYERPIERRITIAALIDLMERVNDSSPVTINKAQKNVVEIYETIQEYNSLWYELMITHSGYSNLPMAEIKGLESVSAYLYNDYRKLKLYIINSEQRALGKKDKDLEIDGLAGMLSIMSMPGVRGGANRSPVPEFTSYYDLLNSRHIPTFGDPTPPSNYVNVPEFKARDSITALNKAQEQYGVWG